MAETTMVAWTIAEVEDPTNVHSFDEKATFHAIEFPAQHGSTVMKLLAKAAMNLKDMGYGHLKRMKKAAAPGRLLALVAPDAAVVATVIEALPTVNDLVTVCVDVPKYAATTKDEFAAGNAEWPMVFHPNVDATSVPLTDDEVRHMQAFVSRLYEEATDAPSTLANGCGRQHCLVVNPLTNTIVASAADWTPVGCNPLMQHAPMQALEVVSIQDVARDQSQAATESYLCTGYDVYVAVEPCVMCAMALVHSRVRRVIYFKKNAGSGALGSNYYLHTKRSLNHRYRVFHACQPSP
ncbi:hypothetical protein SPRG_04296 [Saprolegnia parasitica CBS 223.65]|uniref:CMP/dCMP-type deaminase domain-containing protein n=1 Tax=Saprolegnia parasitica (strain CBS 223.65) TaxID=695850 RepID=A0A067CXB8_SAPPC|nr:hypothetical protein SPRG_04296 [Saprolegnia parasitica CBS 223.65]KDO31156.1 hypothetical protein SPRG_04296 [Saprolegnia parasitica CBS 223.65]|eukprot:XP_012198281.1 hypothetical protein SPRG_04296 [Saprolegnia parasitica CBS 223.65]